MMWKIRNRTLDLSRPRVMGIVNLTPDSFSDGGRLGTVDAAVAHARRLVADGADLLDIGGESSRPGAEPVSAAEEWARVGTVLARLKREVKVPLSVDTVKADVAERALNAGCHIVNDITGLTGDPRMAEVVKRHGAGAVVMHMQGTPRSMQEAPAYADVVGEVTGWLMARCEALIRGGMAADALVVDPGIGFGKTAEHNLALLAQLTSLTRIGVPVLIGPSRKAFLGKILDAPVEDRVEGTVAAAALAVWNGARIVRVHDVKAVVRAVKVVEAMLPYKHAESGMWNAK